MWKVKNATLLEDLEYPVLGRQDFAKLTPKIGRVFPTFLLPPELIWGSHMLGVCDIITLLRGPIWLTNYNFHPHGLYCITIHYHSCSIDIYRTVKDVKCHNFGRLGISHLEKERVLQISTQKLQEFPPHSFSPPELIWSSPMPWRLRYHQPFIGSYPIDKL